MGKLFEIENLHHRLDTGLLRAWAPLRMRFTLVMLQDNEDKTVIYVCCALPTSGNEKILGSPGEPGQGEGAGRVGAHFQSRPGSLSRTDLQG